MTDDEKIAAVTAKLTDEEFYVGRDVLHIRELWIGKITHIYESKTTGAIAACVTWDGAFHGTYGIDILKPL